MTTAPTAPTGPAVRTKAGRTLWLRWVHANAAGELVGLGLTGAAAAAAMLAIAPRHPLVAACAVPSPRRASTRSSTATAW